MAMAKIINVLIAVGGLFGWLSGGASGATVEETLSAINKLSAKDRQRRLEEGAKKEGNLVIYSNHGIETTQEYADAFGQKYPFIKVEPSRLQGSKGLDRILLEHRVGKLTADIVGVDFDNIGELMKAGVHGRYESPEKKNYAKQYWDKDSRWYVPHSP